MSAKTCLMGVCALALATGAASAQTRTGAQAFGDWHADAPGVTRLIRPDDLPPPNATKPAATVASIAPRPDTAPPQTLPGFSVAPFAHLDHARQIRVAPNGDIFVAQTDLGKITVLRAAEGAAAPARAEVFAEGLDRPFGMAFWPNGRNPKFLYVALNNSVLRFPYHAGDLKAAGASSVILAQISQTSGGHTTRDLDVTRDGQRLLLSVGSGSNLAEGMPLKTADEIKTWETQKALGASWGREADRANLISFNPDGSDRKIFATGLRNCVTVRVSPATGAPWCVVNERDVLGDDLPPDYATSVKAGGFYGWPWYYIGAHKDPRPKQDRADLADKITTPDVLFQPHSAPLGIAFYSANKGVAAFPSDYSGDAFVALHGSWNRAIRAGYKIVRLKFAKGVPTGEYQDFVTGFVADDRNVYGRPVATAQAKDGSLLFSDDAAGLIWRVAPTQK